LHETNPDKTPEGVQQKAIPEVWKTSRCWLETQPVMNPPVNQLKSKFRFLMPVLKILFVAAAVGKIVTLCFRARGIWIKQDYELSQGYILWDWKPASGAGCL